jgi:hypothetical protein
VSDWYLDRKYRDPDQRAAQKHLHGDLQCSALRLRAFLADREEVRVQVLLELRQLSELNSSGNAAPALTALLGAVTLTATLFGTLVFAIFNGWFAGVVKMTDAETGVVKGITQEQFGDTVNAVAIVLGALTLAVLGASFWAVTHARDKDRRRAVHVAWLEEYARANAVKAGVVATEGAAASEATTVRRFSWRSMVPGWTMSS